ncbi:hypothetical protein CVT26_010153 [Gymnopilus dilepis]|uniref:Uncharacterized protein n=1 Tax=Gymnopilus dilepis TaxID=231916 RepID=A0A409YS32_9AGAR|nr:hypothetical protein CVT26_010153 [Gymnopilus dilepis]
MKSDLHTLTILFLGLFLAVTALPVSLYHSKGVIPGWHPSATPEILDERGLNEDEPIIARYFDGSIWEISEREFEEASIERRGRGGIVKILAKGIEALVNLIKGKIERDKRYRSEWTKKMIDELRSKYPRFNFVICHPKHQFTPKPNTNYGHFHREVKVSFGKTVGYEIYWFQEGHFHRFGDGGWLNWAYGGVVTKKSDRGSTLDFGPSSSSHQCSGFSDTPQPARFLYPGPTKDSSTEEAEMHRHILSILTFGYSKEMLLLRIRINPSASMKSVFTLVIFVLSLFLAVLSLPFPLNDEKGLAPRSTSLALRETFDERGLDENDPIIARYFDGSVWEISEREFEEASIETRGLGVVVKLVAKGITALVDLIKGKIEKDKEYRSQWTSKMIGELRAKYPKFNFVICHTEHRFTPKPNTRNGHFHREINVSFGKTIGYEIYWFQEGHFQRIGDGGWLNWAYAGVIRKKSDGGKTLDFGRP